MNSNDNNNDLITISPNHAFDLKTFTVSDSDIRICRGLIADITPCHILVHGKAGTGPVIQSGWCLAIEPMVNLGGDAVITLSDGWTVVTRDGLPSAHYELAIAITDSGTQILTLTSDDEYP